MTNISKPLHSHFSIFIVLYSLDHYLCCAARRVRFFVTIWATGGQAARLFYPWDFSGKLLEWVAISSSTIYCRTFLSPLEEPHLPNPFDPQPLATTDCFLSRWVFLFCISYQWTHTMCGLFSLSIMFTRFIHVATCISISFIFMAQ